jgi:hypothetical protein
VLRVVGVHDLEAGVVLAQAVLQCDGDASLLVFWLLLWVSPFLSSTQDLMGGCYKLIFLEIDLIIIIIIIIIT